MSWKFAYDSPKAITRLLDAEGLSMSKKFGQNFLLSRHIRENIVNELSLEPQMKVWEVGPGIGSLTANILETGCAVTAFEIDHGFCRILSTQAFVDDENFRLVEGDALKTWEKIFRSEGTPDRICGNLPYNVGSIVIAKLLENECLPEKMVYTLQKEVADRLSASPGEKAWSSFSLLAQMDYTVKTAFTISSSCFYPEPNVSSSVITMVKREQPLVDKAIRAVFLSVVRDLFSQKRKTIKNNLLSGNVGARFGKDGVASILEKSGVDPGKRAEQLSWEHFISISEAVSSC
ncbi:16S rRNA (adenine(1518)-N(6)/adenine(1519)-N(6))-dimethyltransferase RsmA [Sphaerochaeta sp. PS]|uniref:16S rRNA (adenine(1518)-N(6)/adenine(1519)-N(6))- dimethyltransferase RsmA n=1 Tax=Sphaerochaeta sp. PS TaxID=3076336 RepID=UPI0028A5701D|nr:16S rRNA (adenine(1518)-N(6)/adenine(1519)-N(6))-dimethyltransferase RsmA [Sphaerochaeta sp. PS]MDT4762353.1 16S rRNA (adenine(1518)-N(6)/adenine(1519)-N(6))-dimethyltransferase RsmA [Sphaerochaeta sp. PS]